MRRWLVVSALLTLWTGCVRLAEPDAFACDGPGDCQPGEKCLRQLCQPKDFCETAGDCSTRALCTNQRCQAVECLLHADCGLKEQCENLSCVEQECTQNTHCSERALCVGFECVEQECTNGAHCERGICLDSYVCGCSVDSHCFPYACGFEHCYTTCSSDSHCAPGAVCAGTECLPIPEADCQGCAPLDAPCLEDQNCSEGRCCYTSTADHGSCLEGPCSGGEVGASCAHDNFCSEGPCVLGSCAEAGACGDDSDCETGSCCPSPTGTTRECRQDCTARVGDACFSDGACHQGSCELSGDVGICSAPCGETTSCDTDARGLMNVCVPLLNGTSVCRPRCEVDAPCQDILDGLSCFEIPSTGDHACDFSAEAWAG